MKNNPSNPPLVIESDITNSVKMILESLSCHYDGDLDLDDPNLSDTPLRVAKSLIEITCGYEDDPSEILSKRFPSEDYDQMIVVKDIDYYSTCIHHMMPFHGKVAIGYLPNSDTREVIGLSKLPRLVRCFSRRLQIQERMTMEIAKAIEDHLKPRGVGVLVYDSIHLCSHMRGIEERHSTMVTSALLGEFRSDASVRAEFYSLVVNGLR